MYSFEKQLKYIMIVEQRRMLIYALGHTRTHTQTHGLVFIAVYFNVLFGSFIYRMYLN